MLASLVLSDVDDNLQNPVAPVILILDDARSLGESGLDLFREAE